MWNVTQRIQVDFSKSYKQAIGCPLLAERSRPSMVGMRLTE